MAAREGLRLPEVRLRGPRSGSCALRRRDEQVLSFLSGAKDLVDGARGITATEIDALTSEWGSRFPDSLLAQVMEIRLLEAAAWQARGPGCLDTVTAERRRTFDELDRVALRKVQAFPRRVRARAGALGGVTWRYVALRASSDTGAGPALRDLTLAASQRDPLETDLAVYADRRMVADWGGSAALLEK